MFYDEFKRRYPGSTLTVTYHCPICNEDLEAVPIKLDNRTLRPIEWKCVKCQELLKGRPEQAYLSKFTPSGMIAMDKPEATMKVGMIPTEDGFNNDIKFEPPKEESK